MKAVLFDLDGTLTDSAPQLAASANHLRRLYGVPPLPLGALREAAGKGARGLIGAALHIAPAAPSFEGLKKEFLADYEARLDEPALLFSGIEPLIDALEARHLPWGIVTNKAEHLARLVVNSSPLLACAHCLVGGDTTPHMKPHPEPVLLGARLLGCLPADCLFVGDDARDIAAGRAAGTRTAALAWGYGANSDTWGADFTVAEPRELVRILGLM